MEQSSRQKKAGSIGRCKVGQAGSESIFSEFLRVSSTENFITLDGGIDNLGDDSSIGDSGNQSILGGIIFIFVLLDESFPGIVVGFALSSPFEFGLEAHEISFVLNKLDEGHLWIRIIKY